MDEARVPRRIPEDDRVDSRTRLALGGMATVAASVAVVASVAMTTSFALADSAGSPVGARPVVVPSASSTPVRTPEPVGTGEAPAPAAPVVVAELVPAPAPEFVPSSEPDASAPEPSAADQEQLVGQVETSGSWDSVYAWAQERGWSRGRVEALIRRLEAHVWERRGDDGTGNVTWGSSDTLDEKSSRLSEETGKMSGRELSGSWSGSKREQSRVPPN
jgi:hypothetical protein